jgi:hypothetical protein
VQPGAARFLLLHQREFEAEKKTEKLRSWEKYLRKYKKRLIDLVLLNDLFLFLEFLNMKP